MPRRAVHFHGPVPRRGRAIEQRDPHSGDGTGVALEVNHQTEDIMITMFFIGLVGAAAILGILPFLAFSLMLETCAKRRSEQGKGDAASARSAGESVQTVVCGQHGVALLAG